MPETVQVSDEDYRVLQDLSDELDVTVSDLLGRIDVEEAVGVEVRDDAEESKMYDSISEYMIHLVATDCDRESCNYLRVALGLKDEIDEDAGDRPIGDCPACGHEFVRDDVQEVLVGEPFVYCPNAEMKDHGRFGRDYFHVSELQL